MVAQLLNAISEGVHVSLMPTPPQNVEVFDVNTTSVIPEKAIQGLNITLVNL